ncbi:alpha/beta hydrolase family protein [Paenibacillus sp. OSY-SE]|uniref:alpha/beta hydrolase family protein n=1 Tax=Paenibacillus sp. OSY-SE TaxID=1196323 RepID=UPI00030986BA|nr:prolyl oligopeptidase family serine peptidase [Paenibacillus sp. OSY-SE]
MIYHITYLSDGLRVKGYLSLPYGHERPASEIQSNIERFYGEGNLPVTEIAHPLNRANQDLHEQQWPVLIYCRGGMGKFGRVKSDWLEQFSQFGHLVFAPTYRGNEGGEGRDEFGGAEQEDVRSAYRLLQSLSFVDPSRISVMGFSRGAINAAQTAVGMPDIHRLILWSGVSDLAQTYEERMELRRMLKRVIGGNPVKKRESYIARSPLYMAEDISCPILLIHGTEDAQVDFSHGLQMFKKLQQDGADVDMHTFDGYGHLFPPDIHQQSVKRMFAWISRDTTKRHP